MRVAVGNTLTKVNKHFNSLIINLEVYSLPEYSDLGFSEYLEYCNDISKFSQLDKLINDEIKSKSKKPIFISLFSSFFCLKFLIFNKD